MVGLGNPGPQYAATRHNLGFMVVDELLRRAGERAHRGPGDYDAARVLLAGSDVLLVKPRTYVNRTGRAVQQLVAEHAVEPPRILAIVDDVYLPFGRLRLRPSGGAGGHNGLQSVLEALGSENFPRLRLGIGAPDDPALLADWVLTPFAPEEQAAVPRLVGRAADAVASVAALGVEAAMPVVNAVPPPGNEPAS